MKPVVSLVAIALVLAPTWAFAAPSQGRGAEAASIERVESARAPSKGKRGRRAKHRRAKAPAGLEAPRDKEVVKALPALPAPQGARRASLEPSKLEVEQPRAAVETRKAREERSDHGVDHGEPPMLVPASLAARPRGKGVTIERTTASARPPGAAAHATEASAKTEKAIERTSAEHAGAHGAEKALEKGSRTPKGIERVAASGRSAHPILRTASAKHRVDAAARDASERAAKTVSDDKAPKRTSARKKEKPCFKDDVELIRGAEVERFPLLTCSGDVAKSAVDLMSIVARPGSIDRPAKDTRFLDGEEVVPGIRRLDSGLVSRVGAIVSHFTKPGKIAKIAVVSGYRPGSTGSQHKDGKALDIRLEGVSNEEVVEFCKTLSDTGCGYYPNSSFVHVDARAPGAGHVHWIDASGPGEKPRYVTAWPPPKEPEAPEAPAADDAPQKAEVALNAAPAPKERATKESSADDEAKKGAADGQDDADDDAEE